jgi:pimeloyl-ACP methyl ester carboxylesterase
MSELTHRTVVANGIRIHLVEQGEGPVVLLVHGFPESWWSWRNQLPALAEAGHRAVAIDVRGYGRSQAPAAVDDYRMLVHVADNVGVLAALGVEEATVVGHDWGSPIAWHSALLRPDLFTRLVMLSVPYSAPGGRRPTEAFKALAGDDEEFYIGYFQEPGRAEAEMEPDVRGWIRGFYLAASGDAPSTPDGGTIATVRRGGLLRDRFPAGDHPLPAWITEDDLDFYAAEFEHSGMTGPLNRYRNVDRDWADTAAFSRRPITVPSLFIGGDRDGPTIWGGGAISRFAETLPALHGSHILEGCGHWTQQERAGDVNRLLLEFLAATR